MFDDEFFSNEEETASSWLDRKSDERPNSEHRSANPLAIVRNADHRIDRLVVYTPACTQQGDHDQPEVSVPPTMFAKKPQEA